MEVAADVVELARLARESLREGLGFGQRRERGVDPGDQAMAGRDSDQCAAALGRFPGGGESDGIGIDRRLTFAGFAPQPAAQHVERDDVVGRLRQPGATLRQGERALGLQRGRLRQRGVEVRARRLGRFGAIEVFGDEHRIALAVPLRGGAMQLRAAGPRQRRVDAVPDQRVREQILVAFRQDEKVRHQHIAGKIGQLRELPNQREREALADDRRRAQRRAVAFRQPIHSREHQARKRRREAILLLGGGTHQLLEEQRVAARSFDALARKLGRRGTQSVGERKRVLRAERAEVDRQQRTSLHRSAPHAV